MRLNSRYQTDEVKKKKLSVMNRNKIQLQVKASVFCDP